MRAPVFTTTTNGQLLIRNGLLDHFVWVQVFSGVRSQVVAGAVVTERHDQGRGFISRGTRLHEAGGLSPLPHGPLHRLLESLYYIVAGLPQSRPSKRQQGGEGNDFHDCSLKPHTSAFAACYWSDEPTLIQSGRGSPKARNTREAGTLGHLGDWLPHLATG